LPFHHHDVHHHAESGHGGRLEQAAGGQGDAACAPADPAGGLGEPASPAHSVPYHEHPGQWEQLGRLGGTHTRRSLTWGAALAGLSLHSALDGMALAASTTAEHGKTALAGMGVFLAVVLHKPFDALTLGTLLAVAGSSRRLRHLVNAGYSLAVPAGALLFLLASRLVSDRGASITAPALAFAAGMFLCIAAADLLPELHFHAHDRIKLSVALVLGLALAAGIVAWEEMYHDHQDHAAEHATEDSAAHKTSRPAAAHERWTLASACRVQAGCGPDALFQPAFAANGSHQLENLVDQLVLSPHGHGLVQRAPHQQAQARAGRQQV
ncbi:MAG: ZIP family metal transporter, partial [Pirellulales bacterium]|nr:ZIP family metal transporter [Pirellulales bacterium]